MRLAAQTPHPAGYRPPPSPARGVGGPTPTLNPMKYPMIPTCVNSRSLAGRPVARVGDPGRRARRVYNPTAASAPACRRATSPSSKPAIASSYIR